MKYKNNMNNMQIFIIIIITSCSLSEPLLGKLKPGVIKSLNSRCTYNLVIILALQVMYLLYH